MSRNNIVLIYSIILDDVKFRDIELYSDLKKARRRANQLKQSKALISLRVYFVDSMTLDYFCNDSNAELSKDLDFDDGGLYEKILQLL